MFGLLKILFSDDSDKDKKKKKADNRNKCKYSEDELGSYELTEDEKELVRKGEYDPWQFDDDPDELEDDDYYYDDE